MNRKDEIPFDGFGNAIEMLHHADAAFRDKIIRNIAKRDPALAQRLLQATRSSLSRDDKGADYYTRPDDSYAESQQILERTQRSLRTRSYGR